MRLIRSKSFETNSSSSHSVTIVKPNVEFDKNLIKEALMKHFDKDLGKVVINLDHRRQCDPALNDRFSMYDTVNEVNLALTSKHNKNVCISIDSDDTYMGFGDFVGKLILVFGLLIYGYSGFEENELEFSGTPEDAVVDEFFDNCSAAQVINECSRFIGYPILFTQKGPLKSFLFESLINELDEGDGVDCGFLEDVDLDFLLNRDSYVVSRWSDL